MVDDLDLGILGYTKDEIETHSLHSGCAIALHLAGVPVYMMMLIGCWIFHGVHSASSERIRNKCLSQNDPAGTFLYHTSVRNNFLWSQLEHITLMAPFEFSWCWGAA